MQLKLLQTLVKIHRWDQTPITEQYKMMLEINNSLLASTIVVPQ